METERETKLIGPANRSSTGIHPNNSIIKRGTSGFAPNKGGLPLIGDANSLQTLIHVEPISGGLVHSLSNTHLHTLQYLHGIMLHPPTPQINTKSQTHKNFPKKIQTLNEKQSGVVASTSHSFRASLI